MNWQSFMNKVYGTKRVDKVKFPSYENNYEAEAFSAERFNECLLLGFCLCDLYS